jgi:serine/threonine protein kinase
MATIWIGHAADAMLPVTRPLAIKMLNAHGSSPELITMFLDELAVATKVRHLNIVETIEVISTDDDLGLVMEYIEGETLSRLHRACREQNTAMPIPIAARIIIGALHGLSAVHEAKDERSGRPLEIVHRDISPQNIVVGIDGIPRLLDFGVAKAAVRLQQTRTGQLKGKVAYMAPEQLETNEVSPLSDVYAMAIVLWEALTARRLFEAETEGQLIHRVLLGSAEPPSSVRGAEVPKELDAVVLKALSKSIGDRYPSARHLAGAIELATPLATTSEVAAFLQQLSKKTLEARARRVAKMLGNHKGEPESGVGPASSPSLLSSRPSSGSLRAEAPTERSLISPLSTGGLRSSVRSQTPKSFAAVQVGGGEEGTSPTIGAGPGGGASASKRPPGKHVLIIDDSQVILDNARRVLEADGYKVTTTTQTVGAARHLVDCDLALIDYHMPGLNGADVIQSFRAASAASNRSCLFYLFTSDPDVAKTYAKVGFDGSLTGKGDDDALLRGVRAAFRVLQLRAMKK